MSESKTTEAHVQEEPTHTSKDVLFTSAHEVHKYSSPTSFHFVCMCVCVYVCYVCVSVCVGVCVCVCVRAFVLYDMLPNSMAQLGFRVSGK